MTTFLAQFLGALALYFGLRYTARTLRLNQQGQMADRFRTAIDQLGAKDGNNQGTTHPGNLELRLGAIYGLQQVAQASKQFYWPVVEVLTAYLRLNARFSAKDPERTKKLTEVEPVPRSDVQAILNVLRDRP